MGQPVGFTQARIASERGVGIIELLAAIPMFTLVLGLVFGFYNATVNQQSTAESSAHAIVNAENGLERMGRDFRAVAPPVAGGDATIAVSLMYVEMQVCGSNDCAPAQRRWVSINCIPQDSHSNDPADHACVRAQTAAGAAKSTLYTAPASEIVNNVKLDIGGIFSWDSSRSYMRVELPVRTRSGKGPRAIQHLSAGFAVRNLITTS